MTLDIGENKAYIIVYHPDGQHWSRYEIVLYRLDILEYAFYNEEGIIKEGTIEENSNIIAPTSNPSKTGYTFKGWMVNGSEVAFPYKATKEALTEGSIVFEPIYEINTYSIQYVLNGGANNALNPDTYTIEEKVVLEAPSRAGYTFAGWFVDTSFNNGTTGIEKGNGGDITFYAKWIPNQNTLIFNANGGTGSMLNMTIATGESVSLTRNTYKKSGYTFRGWSTTKDGAVEYLNGASYKMGVESKYTLYAVWEIVTYNITYKLNGGTNNASNLATYTVDDLPLNLTNPKHSYREFMGWYTDANLTIKLENDSLLGDITLYAKWGSVLYTEYSTYVAVTGYDGTDTTVVIPYAFNNKPVISIGNYAFSDCYSLTSVTIPDSVTSIGDYAFYNCSNLTSVTIGDGVTSIGEYAFERCNSLTSITIPDSVTSIGDYAFEDCDSLTSVNYLGTIENWCNISFSSSYANPLYNGVKLYLNGKLVTELTIPSTVTEIKDYAFYNCKTLTSVTIPDSVTSIGNYAFYICNSLTSVTIGDGVTSIGVNAFSGCYSLTSVNYLGTIENWCNISFSSSPFWNGAKLYLNGELVAELTIPSTVTEIKDYAFCNCDSLTSVTIPDSVISIGSSAFSGCDSLKSVKIGNGVTRIGSSAFCNCSSLRSVKIGNGVTSIGYDAFYNCSSLPSVTIPDSVTSIGSSAFCNCSRLTSVNYLGTIENWCNISFSNSSANPLCNGAKLCLNGEQLVTELVIPSTVTEIKDYAFSDCDSLTSITIPDSVTGIGGYAFEDCSRLTSVTIGDGVTSIGEYAFDYCDSLTSVTIPDSVTSIGEYAFRYCSSLTSVTIGNSVTSIGGYAFYDCDSLTSVNYLGTIENWCNISFSDSYANPLCNGAKLYLNGELVTELTIPSTVTEIKDYAFYNCDSLTSVTIGNSVISIGNFVFEDCYRLTIYCEATSKPSGWYSWWNGSNRPVVWDCKNNTVASDGYIYTVIDGIRYGIKDNTATVVRQPISIVEANIPSSITYNGVVYPVTSIGNSAFSGCSSLTSVTIPDSVTSIGRYAFEYCSNLTSVTIPDSVTSIGSYAFYNCTSLTSITIPDSVTSIGEYAFRYCSSLTIYCEVESKPSGWNSSWNYSGCPVVWGHTHSYTDGKCICGMKEN